MVEFRNWSGSLAFAPATIAEPGDVGELVELVAAASNQVGRVLRPVGAGHSSSPLVRTEDTLVSLHRLSGLVEHDSAAATATVRAGTMLADLGPALHEVGLALHNYGDVDLQALAGAVGTATHGTGKRGQLLQHDRGCPGTHRCRRATRYRRRRPRPAQRRPGVAGCARCVHRAADARRPDVSAAPQGMVRAHRGLPESPRRAGGAEPQFRLLLAPAPRRSPAAHHERSR
ncbi:MAG: FAD-binding protein [Pseudonocardiales bacterium]|nr:FAD-binding protein [Pseudonocardiales bacterium]